MLKSGWSKVGCQAVILWGAKLIQSGGGSCSGPGHLSEVDPKEVLDHARLNHLGRLSQSSTGGKLLIAPTFFCCCSPLLLDHSQLPNGEQQSGLRGATTPADRHAGLAGTGYLGQLTRNPRAWQLLAGALCWQ